MRQWISGRTRAANVMSNVSRGVIFSEHIDAVSTHRYLYINVASDKRQPLSSLRVINRRQFATNTSSKKCSARKC